MKTAELVRKLLDAGANAEAVQIAIQAVEEAAEEARPKRRRAAAKPKLAAAR
jgi:hypothetical protein